MAPSVGYLWRPLAGNLVSQRWEIEIGGEQSNIHSGATVSFMTMNICKIFLFFLKKSIYIQNRLLKCVKRRGTIGLIP